MSEIHLHSPNEEDVARALPHAVGPEKSVLSSMLQEPLEFIGRAIEMGIDESHFYLPDHAVLFSELCHLNEAGESIDLTTLVQKLLDRGKLDRVGGPAGLAGIYSYSASPIHFAKHVQFLKEKRLARGIIQIANTSISAVYDEPENVTGHLEEMESALSSLRDAGASGNSIVTARQAVKAVVDRIERTLKGEQSAGGFATGFSELDRMTRGLKPGEMFVLAARPSMGKTSFMMNIVEHVAVDQQKPTLVFSAEMTWDQVTERMILSRAKIPSSAIVPGATLNKGELQRLQRASQEISPAPLFTDDTAGISIAELRAKARRKKRENDIGFIAIDYLQLMKSGSKQARDSREREIAEISAGIKGLAKELGVPILILAQLNRGPEGRTGQNLGVPRMSDLRESGAIEQDADMVGLLYRKAYYLEDPAEKEADAGVATLKLAKNRNGETGDVPLTWIAPLMRFESGEPAKEEPNLFERPAPRSRFDD